jgi:hypothetical protein
MPCGTPGRRGHHPYWEATAGGPRRRRTGGSCIGWDRPTASGRLHAVSRVCCRDGVCRVCGCVCWRMMRLVWRMLSYGTLHRLRWCTPQLRAGCMVPSRIFTVCCVRAAACHPPSAVLCGRNTTPCDSAVEYHGATACGCLRRVAGHRRDLEDVVLQLQRRRPDRRAAVRGLERLQERGTLPVCHPGVASSMLFMYLGRSSASRFSRRRNEDFVEV